MSRMKTKAKMEKDFWNVKSDYVPTKEELQALDYLAKFLVDEFYEQIKQENLAQHSK